MQENKLFLQSRSSEWSKKMKEMKFHYNKSDVGNDIFNKTHHFS